MVSSNCFHAFCPWQLFQIVHMSSTCGSSYFRLLSVGSLPRLFSWAYTNLPGPSWRQQGWGLWSDPAPSRANITATAGVQVNQGRPQGWRPHHHSRPHPRNAPLPWERAVSLCPVGIFCCCSCAYWLLSSCFLLLRKVWLCHLPFRMWKMQLEPHFSIPRLLNSAFVLFPVFSIRPFSFSLYVVSDLIRGEDTADQTDSAAGLLL